MKITRRVLLVSLLWLITATVFAQGAPREAQMADTMRSNGRIYVVVAVVLTILLGLIFYVYRLDRKISKLEKENK